MRRGQRDHPGPSREFVHEAALYHGRGGFVADTAEFIRAGVEAGEAVLAVVPPELSRLLRAELGEITAAVSFLDMTTVGRNPARVIPVFRDLLDDAGARGVSARAVSESMWADRSAAEIRECQLHESLVNLAFDAAGSTRFRLRCPYDVAALPTAVVDEVWRTHPEVISDGALKPSSSYHPPVARLPTEPLPEPPAGVVPVARVRFAASGLLGVRRAVTVAARGRGVTADRAAELELAVHEIATNSLRYGGGWGLLRIWAEEGFLVCEVSDRGRLRDPLAGRWRPPPDAENGRGLWLANQLCDLVRIRSSPAGTTVRLQVECADRAHPG